MRKSAADVLSSSFFGGVFSSFKDGSAFTENWEVATEIRVIENSL
jgi:hypothetical protein